MYTANIAIYNVRTGTGKYAASKFLSSTIAGFLFNGQISNGSPYAILLKKMDVHFDTHRSLFIVRSIICRCSSYNINLYTQQIQHLGSNSYIFCFNNKSGKGLREHEYKKCSVMFDC